MCGVWVTVCVECGVCDVNVCEVVWVTVCEWICGSAWIWLSCVFLILTSTRVLVLEQDRLSALSQLFGLHHANHFVRLIASLLASLDIVNQTIKDSPVQGNQKFQFFIKFPNGSCNQNNANGKFETLEHLCSRKHVLPAVIVEDNKVNVKLCKIGANLLVLLCFGNYVFREAIVGCRSKRLEISVPPQMASCLVKVLVFQQQEPAHHASHLVFAAQFQLHNASVCLSTKQWNTHSYFLKTLLRINKAVIRNFCVSFVFPHQM